MVLIGGPVRRNPGGIVAFLDAVDKHRGAFEYDWRNRLGMRLDVPAAMSYGEAWRITGELLKDTSSHVSAAIGGWDYPLSREALSLANISDGYAAVHSKKGAKVKPTPRPWDNAGKFGRTKVPQPQVRAALRARGHNI